MCVLILPFGPWAIDGVSSWDVGHPVKRSHAKCTELWNCASENEMVPEVHLSLNTVTNQLLPRAVNPFKNH